MVDGWDGEGEPMSVYQITDVEKRAATTQVLQSITFLRADQVRNFLRYICDMELAGRAAELSEYLVGVEAMGRPSGYSTADDSSVRRRAYALRQKLGAVYQRELAHAEIRIEVPKGSYVPRFVRVAETRTVPGPARIDRASTVERTMF